MTPWIIVKTDPRRESDFAHRIGRLGSAFGAFIPPNPRKKSDGTLYYVPLYPRHVFVCCPAGGAQAVLSLEGCKGALASADGVLWTISEAEMHAFMRDVYAWVPERMAELATEGPAADGKRGGVKKKGRRRLTKNERKKLKRFRGLPTGIQRVLPRYDSEDAIDPATGELLAA